MKTTLLTILFILSISVAFSQPYKSMFGQFSTAWVFQWSNLFGSVRDSAFIEKDTLVNGITYKKVITKDMLSGYPGGLLREDINAGKVWYRDVKSTTSPSDTAERLVYDFSLHPGDTFDISNSVFFATPYIDTVDSVKIIGGLKYIFFKAKLFYANEPYTMIESIGSNLGIVANKKQTIMVGPYLLCSYKDGEKTTYTNKWHKGDCNPPLAVNDTEMPRFRIFPNPASESITIEYDLGKMQLDKVQFIGLDGRLIRQFEKSFAQLSLADIQAGIYFLHLYTHQGFAHAQPIIIKP